MWRCGSNGLQSLLIYEWPSAAKDEAEAELGRQSEATAQAARVQLKFVGFDRYCA